MSERGQTTEDGGLNEWGQRMVEEVRGGRRWWKECEVTDDGGGNEREQRRGQRMMEGVRGNRGWWKE